MKRVLLLMLALAFVLSAPGALAEERATATAQLIDPRGATIGTATLTQLNDTLVTIAIEASGLTPGRHGIHIHSIGQCTLGTTPAFTSAGGHFNPGNADHGLHNPTNAHAGDLHNLVARPDGTVNFALTTSRVTLLDGPTSLFDANDSALVIHAGEDDQMTDPAGNSGARVACGVVRRG